MALSPGPARKTCRVRRWAGAVPCAETGGRSAGEDGDVLLGGDEMILDSLALRAKLPSIK